MDLSHYKLCGKITTAAKKKAVLRENGLSAQLPMSALGLLPSKSPILRMGVSIIANGKRSVKNKEYPHNSESEKSAVIRFFVATKTVCWNLEET